MANYRNKITVGDYFRKNWLLVGILLCILLAAVYPSLGSKHGPLRTDYTVKYGAISLIFLISGLTLKTDTLLRTLQQYRLHLFIQLFTFLLIPIFAQFLTKILATFGTNPWLLKGIVIAACMPPPVSSAVILTRAANGNETAAIFNSVLGSFLGVLLTPLSLLAHLGATTIVPLPGTVVQLALTVLLPLLLGQALLRLAALRPRRPPLAALGQAALLLVVYATFCDTFEAPEAGISAADVLITVFAVLLMQVVLIAASFALADRFRRVFTQQDCIAIVFCSTHKSLTLGIPILRIMFHGYSHLSQVSLPLLVYHPTQIILGGFLVSHLKEWVSEGRNQKWLPV